MINTLNANTNVGEVWIKLSNDNQLSDRIVTMMVNRYSNAIDISEPIYHHS